MTSTTPDGYLATLLPDQRDALSDLRRVLCDLLPEAEQVMSYAMPGFRQGKMVAGYAAYSQHCGLYPHSGTVIPQLADRIDALGFRRSKSGVLFTPAKPLPRDLVARIVALRLAEIGA